MPGSDAGLELVSTAAPYASFLDQSSPILLSGRSATATISGSDHLLVVFPPSGAIAGKYAVTVFEKPVLVRYIHPPVSSWYLPGGRPRVRSLISGVYSHPSGQALVRHRRRSVSSTDARTGRIGPLPGLYGTPTGFYRALTELVNNEAACTNEARGGWACSLALTIP